MSSNGVPRTLKFLRTLNGGMTQEQLAQRLSVSTSLIAKFETARQIPLPDTAEQIDDVFGSGTLVQETAEDARNAVPPDWFQPWPEYEAQAEMLRGYESTYVPGLLQTEAYARAVLAVGMLAPEVAEQRLAHRLARQVTVFDRRTPPVTSFIVDEAALRRGDPVMMKEQLLHLVEMSRRDRVLLHVVPLDAGLYAGQLGNFALATLPDGATVAYAENPVDGRTYEEPAKVGIFVNAWEAIRSVALPRDASRDLIARMAEEL
ncbi:helix-turn-helix transcriptional regulator [Solwaraspora sp. WMMD937]|uniref:helix-turn-helix domain-containing protein n=1 Tax=Solwaraspora sp. WMMD937 TaxID=3016090 RepID=UPI00249B5D7A|nr:helix-turn-helix transcriptional regulator [Solwaraspora sp. WMMD937]WFE23033.1 helix-turn-helix transcriptional regulator [Solwaraspora sp. WMMD937]